MIFDSLTYLFFLLSIIFIGLFVSWRFYLTVLAFGSYVFYSSWDFTFSILFSGAILLDYWFASYIISFHGYRIKKSIILCLGIASNLGLLFYFKYQFFIMSEIHAVFDVYSAETLKRASEIVLPLGISFFVFQKISYLVDVARGEVNKGGFVNYFLYIFFFPQLIAGPIVRAKFFFTQLDREKRLSPSTFCLGIETLIIGLFLKTVLADNIAPFVDSSLMVSIPGLGLLDIVTMSFLFGMQLFFDFFGYSLIAIGSALLVGIRLPVNFRAPYLATSFQKFWQCWHVTLGRWVRRYVYDQLKVALKKTTINTYPVCVSFVSLFCAWIVMGLWHGASWSFAVWGLYHGFLIWIERRFRAHLSKIPAIIRWGGVILLVMMGWLPFLYPDISDLIAVLSRTLDLSMAFKLGLRENVYLVAFASVSGYFSYVFIFGFLRKKSTPFFRIFRYTFLLIATCLVIVFLNPSEEFIYFQF